MHKCIPYMHKMAEGEDLIVTAIEYLQIKNVGEVTLSGTAFSGATSHKGRGKPPACGAWAQRRSPG